VSTFTPASVAYNKGRQIPIHPYPKPLAPGTRVRRVMGKQIGIVQDTIFRDGSFPVDWTGGWAELCAADDVAIISVP
jgi:hypothetical protein